MQCPLVLVYASVRDCVRLKRYTSRRGIPHASTKRRTNGNRITTGRMLTISWKSVPCARAQVHANRHGPAVKGLYGPGKRVFMGKRKPDAVRVRLICSRCQGGPTKYIPTPSHSTSCSSFSLSSCIRQSSVKLFLGEISLVLVLTTFAHSVLYMRYVLTLYSRPTYSPMRSPGSPPALSKGRTDAVELRLERCIVELEVGAASPLSRLLLNQRQRSSTPNGQLWPVVKWSRPEPSQSRKRCEEVLRHHV